MHPTIRDGERVTIEPVRAEMVRRGDILLYSRRERVIAHRVVNVRKASGANVVFTLRGDSLSACDAPVRAEQVLGRVVTVERKGREINLKGRRAQLRSAVFRRAAHLRRGIATGLKVLRVLRKPVV
jgi:signal peptidase I